MSTIRDSGKDKTMGRVKRLVVAKVREDGGMNRQSMEDFLDSETILSDTIIVDIY